MNFLLFTVFFLSVFIYEPISGLFEPFKYVDEILVLLLASVASIRLKQNRFILLSQEKKIVKFVIALLFIGLMGSFISKAQSLVYVIFDLLLMFKFIIVYFSVRVIAFNENKDYFTTGGYFSIYLLLLLVLSVFVFIDIPFSLFPIFDYRFGNIGSTELFYGHPSRYAFVMQCFFVLLLPLFKARRKWLFLLVIILLLGMLSLRFKYFIFCFLATFSILFLIYQIKIRINIKTVFIITLIFFGGIFIAGDQFTDSYFIHSDGSIYARGLLLLTSIDVAENYFPFGAGFGSYGSYVSSISYSPLYFDYNFDLIPGLSPDKTSFISDSFIALLLGQVGFIGFLLFMSIITMFYSILIEAYNSQKQFSHYYMGGILILTVLVLNSMADTIFTQSRAIFPFVLIAILISKYQYIESKKEAFVL